MSLLPIFDKIIPLEPDQRLMRAAIGGMIAVPIVATVLLYVIAKKLDTKRD